MKILDLSLLMLAVLLAACDNDDSKIITPRSDTLQPVITMQGNASDTAYLYTMYKDPGAEIMTEVNGQLRCSDIHAEVTGDINTGLPGTYYLQYNAKDATGNIAATVTRTVHVVENATTFLNGAYNAACSCTATSPGAKTPTVSTGNYTATIVPGSKSREFELVVVKISDEYVVPITYLAGNIIYGDYFSPDYHLGSKLSGTLSETKNTFTIESTFYKYYPATMYECRNIYTRQMIVNKALASQ